MAEETDSSDKSATVAGGAKRVVKPLAAVLGVLATMGSIWWFALKPRRKLKD
jgi:hypothetical protein